VSVSRSRILLIVALLVALATASDVLGQSGKWDKLGVGGLLVAVAVGLVAVLEPVLTNQLTSIRERRSRQAEERDKGVLQPRGRVPLVREISDPVGLGVHRVPPGKAQRAMPAYVPREIDAGLREAIGCSGFTLLVGDAAAGKTRSAFEAIRAILPGHVLILPSAASGVPAAVSQAHDERECVLWLDNLQPLLRDGGGITRKDIVELLAGTGHHRVILATMRTIDEIRLTGGLGSRGQADPLICIGRDVLDQARRIFVERLFNDAEQARARELAGTDERLAEALRHAVSDGVGIAEYLACGPQLYSLWQDAWARGAWPRAAALIAAAVDCRRAGFTAPLPRRLLEDLHVDYLREHGGAQLLPEDIGIAWDKAQNLHESVGALVRGMDEADCYQVFGYLVDKFRREHGETAPERVARAALEHASMPDAGTIGTTAWFQERYELARDAAERQYAAVSQLAAPDELDVLAVRSNRVATILAVAGQTNDLRELPAAEQEYRAIAEALAGQSRADPGFLLRVRNNLATVLSDQSKQTAAEAELSRALREAAVLAPDDPAVLTARGNFATLLYEIGKWPEAEREFGAVITVHSAALGAEHPVTLLFRNNFGKLLLDQGRLDEAEAELRSVLEICRRTLPPDHPYTAMADRNLTEVLRRKGSIGS
jgi:eukaryotic-like serine/threonine-protein kinase